MTAVLVTASELARALNVSPTAVAKARDAGRLTAIGDRFDLAVAKIQWDANRKRRRAEQRRPEPGDAVIEQSSGGAYWDAKTRREQAEAELAELKAAEQRRELVRRVAVEREIAGRLVALRESLEVLGDRLAALMAVETDPVICRRLIRDEHRKTLATFAEQLEQVPVERGGDDGGS